jgi:type I restriction enzyme S subunit/type I restriction enzyme M protein
LEGLEITILPYKTAVETDATGRLDSSFFKKQFMKVRKMAVTWDRLDIHSKAVICGPFGSNLLNDNYVDQGIPMIRPFNLRSGRADAGDVALLEEGFVNRAGLKTFSVGTVMFARVGEIGAGVNLYERATISPNIIAAELRDSIDPYFVGVFANTRFGLSQLEAGMKVVAQPTISTDAIRALRIPPLSNSFQKEIAEIFRQAVAAQDQSCLSLRTAESTLLLALGLENWQGPEPLSYVRSSQDAFAARRLDAEHFQEKFYAAREALFAAGAKRFIPLPKLLLSLTNGHTPLHHNLSLGEVPFLCAEHVTDFNLSFDSEKRILLEHHENELARTAVFDGDVLLTIKGRIGNAAIAENVPGNININQDVALLRFTDELPLWYIVAYLNSRFGKLQSEKMATGAINPFLGLFSIRQFEVPEFSREVMDDIAVKTQQHVTTARQSKQRAIQLLDVAKRAVEIAIEDSEAAALDYLAGVAGLEDQRTGADKVFGCRFIST